MREKNKDYGVSIKDIEYARRSGRSLLFDLFRPDSACRVQKLITHQPIDKAAIK